MNVNLKLNNVKKSFNSFQLRRINLELAQGRVMALVGPNGAGKTTTLDCIAGIMFPDSGEIEICGIKQNPNTKDWKFNFGYVSSEPIFINTMTGENFLKFVSKYYPSWNFNYMIELIEKLEFDSSVKIHKLSTGNKTKLEIITALSYQPKLLLLDEPTNALDPIIRDRFIEIIFDYMNNEENSVIWSTHIINEVSEIADEFAFLNNGELFEISSKVDLTENWRKIIIPAINEITDIPALIEYEIVDGKLEIITSNYENLIKYLKNNNIEVIDEYYMNVETIAIKNLERYKKEVY